MTNWKKYNSLLEEEGEGIIFQSFLKYYAI